ncbi:GT2 family glycosyltransferase [Isoptericola sp. CG 20/1183]|uniref:GT2 family glycosyltransferase n=1 Tax=Isoptericola halotolerans TaxID=300560 RepID=A0ABX5EDP3_9MICO|nr:MULTISPECIES: glycosyltransferase [Isoptericola]PRZ06528.1 GT2 family glycosyltransferase [Isoptericola halotolerans]PRZ06666.1 GT2 family glycosyltransferase [Isoptericola sp. CG 20/1183]
MTAPHLTQAPTHDEDAPHGTALDPATSQAGFGRVAVTVTTVVVTQGRTPFLQATLDAVAAQDRAPEDVVVVDVDTTESTAGHTDLRMGGRRFVGGAGARTLGEAVDRALAVADLPPSTWLWILHDDSVPAPDALGRLLRAVEHSAAVAVAGCKQRRWQVDDDGHAPAPDPARPGLLVEVGYTVSPLGRRMTGVDDTEIDQGQHDAREDVLAVGLAGALVRRGVWTALGGTDPELGRFGDSLDLCRRARLAGHRVVVVPDAVVHHAQASLRGLRGLRGHRVPAGSGASAASAYARRRSQLYARLVGVPLPLLPVAAVAMLVWAPFAAAYRLALKRPAQARDELLAPVVTVLRVVPWVRGRRRAARTRTQPRRVLRPLQAGWRQVAAERRDARLARAEAQRVVWQPSDLERTELRGLARRRRTALATVLLAAVAVAAAAFGPWQGVLADGGRVVGGALLPAPADLATAAEAATSGWVRDGLGTGAPADPLLLVLTLLTAVAGGSTQVAVNVLIVAALPLAALGGWFAAGTVTRSVWARAAAALVWTAAPGFLESLGTGRVGALLAHLTLPWVVVAVARAVGAHARDTVGPPATRRGSLGAAAAAGLLLAVAVCAAPVLLPVASVAVVGAIAVTWRHWRRLLLVLLPAVVVPLPFWWHAVATWSDGGWRPLLAEPGVPVPTPSPHGLMLLLGHPTAPTPWLSGLVPADGPLALVLAAGPWLLGAGVLVLAVVGLLARRRVVASRLGVALAVVGLVAALLAAGTTVASGETPGGVGAAVHGWPGAGLSVLLLGLGLAALAATPAPGAGRPRRIGVGALAAVALVLPVAGLAVWWQDEARGAAVADLQVTADPVVPAVGQQMQAPPRAARVLQLDRADGIVDYTLLHADGSSLLDSSVVVRARDAGLAPGPARDDVAGLDELVAQVAVGRAPDLAPRLAALGVGAVQLPPGGDPELVTTLDLVPGLARVTEDDVLLWRVGPDDAPPPGWASVLDALPDDGATGSPTRTLAADGTAVDDQVEEGSEDRVLVLAETAGSPWRATLDGRRLTAVEADGRQAFELGGDAGQVAVAYEASSRPPWFALAGLVLVSYVLLALPVGRRRLR